MSASSSITNNSEKNHQTTVKQDRGGFYNIILNQRVIYEVPNT